MTELFEASRQWASRPADQRFTSLTEMQNALTFERDHSRAIAVSARQLQAVPQGDHKGLTVAGANGHEYAPTHFSFGQLASLAKAPAGYLRTIPAELAADCINYGMKFNRTQEDVGLLLYKNGDSILRAATGPNYGRIWNDDIIAKLVEKFGDGATGQWRVPGEFGKRVTITKDNTTLFASDRDMFVFLADEDHRIELPNRRAGMFGGFARGFFIWNSEVGDKTFGLKTFLYDYTCCNRIVWGAEDVKEIRIRHTVSAPDKFIDEIQPALITYANGKASSVVEAIEDARAHRLDDVGDFLSKRFGAGMVATLQAVHKAEEDRPIETRWDAITAATAAARGRTHQDSRVELETEAGKLLKA